MTDPADGKQYHQIYDPPPTKAISSRCVVRWTRYTSVQWLTFLFFRESDKDEHVTSRFVSYEAGIETYDSLIEEFGGFKVNSNQDPDTVYQIIESKLDKPLPSIF